jgi:hypothetical protein
VALNSRNSQTQSQDQYAKWIVHISVRSEYVCSQRPPCLVSGSTLWKLMHTKNLSVPPEWFIRLTYLLTYLLTHSLTHSLHGAEYYLKSWLSLSSSKNILLCLWSPKVHNRIHKSPPLDPILSQLNPVLPIDPYLPKVHVLFSMLRSCQRISPGPRRFEIFRNKLLFYGDGLLAPTPNPQAGGTPLLAVRDCLFNIFAVTFRIWRPSPLSVIWGRAMSWWQGTHLTWSIYKRPV